MTPVSESGWAEEHPRLILGWEKEASSKKSEGEENGSVRL